MNCLVMPVRLGIDMTRRAVESALHQDIGNLCLITIDNGSIDGCGQYLRSLDAPTVIMSYRPSKGLSYVWNKALKFIFDNLKLHHALVVNNDVKLRSDTYRLLLEDGGQFVTGVSVDSAAQMESIAPDNKSPHPSFSCFLIKREVWQKIGPFDESMVTWCSDGDYHLRMEKAGIDAISIAVPFLHEVSGTIRRADPILRDKLCQQADSDRAMFEKKWGFAIGSQEYYSQFRETNGMPYLETGRLA